MRSKANTWFFVSNNFKVETVECKRCERCGFNSYLSRSSKLNNEIICASCSQKEQKVIDKNKKGDNNYE